MFKPATRPVTWAACVALAMSAVAFGPLSAAAQDENPVVATVNGEEIRRDEVIDAIRRMPPQLQQQIQQIPPDVLLPGLAREVAIDRLIAARGYADNLQDSDEIKQRVAEAERNIVRDFWLEQSIEERMSEEAVATAYEEFVAEYLVANPPVDEVRARHILVETEDAGKALIERLKAGEDFAELAMELSTGPTGPNGGDLGYFTKDRMVPEFGEAAFSMDAGEYSETPVQTDFGWHVILVEDRRLTQPPALDDVRGQIEGRLADQYVQEIRADLLEAAEIVVFGPDGEPLETGSTDP